MTRRRRLLDPKESLLAVGVGLAAGLAAHYLARIWLGREPDRAETGRAGIRDDAPGDRGSAAGEPAPAGSGGGKGRRGEAARPRPGPSEGEPAAGAPDPVR